MRARSAGRLVSLAALLSLGLAVLLAATTPPRKRVAAAAALPLGAGKAIAERSCLMCHSATLITQQHKDSSGWEKTITQMETWSAAIPPAERDTLRGYLVKELGPRANR